MLRALRNKDGALAARLVVLIMASTIFGGQAISEEGERGNNTQSPSSSTEGYPTLDIPSFRAKEPAREISIGDDFEVIPDLYFHISDVRRVIISNNRLSRVPKELSNYAETLEELYISGSAISRIDVDFGQFKHLRVLEINNTSIEHMAINFEGMVALERLSLSKNGSISDKTIESIGLNGISIAQAYNLKELIVTGSKIVSIPAGMMYLTKLERVDFSNSCVKSIDSANIVLRKLFEESLNPKIVNFTAPDNSCPG